MPGVRQATERLHPAPAGPVRCVLAKQWLRLLGTRVVPGPLHLLLNREKKAQRCLVGMEPTAQASRSHMPTHLAVADPARAHAQAEGGTEGQGADAVCRQVALQQTPEPAETVPSDPQGHLRLPAPRRDGSSRLQEGLSICVSCVLPSPLARLTCPGSGRNLASPDTRKPSRAQREPRRSDAFGSAPATAGDTGHSVAGRPGQRPHGQRETRAGALGPEEH